MRTFTNRTLLALASAVALSAGESRGQVVDPSDLNELSRQMVDQVRHLGDDVSADLGRGPRGRELVQDARELDQAVDQFRGALRGQADPLRVRQAYAGVDGSWHYFRGQLSQPGVATPAVEQAARRVDAIDARLHQAVGLNAPPPGFYGNGPAPTGAGETMRLAHALVARADGLASAVRYGMANDPNGPALSREVSELARAADAFHDSIGSNQPTGLIAQAFAPVDVIADRVERYVTTNQTPAPVQAAWQAFAAVEVLIHQDLRLPSPQPNLQIGLGPPAGGGASPLVGMSDQLVAQTRAFVEVFGPTAGGVPEGPLMLNDAQRLQAAAADFRQDVTRGLAPNQLAYEFRDVDACWQRLARRVNRVARGRFGANIAQVQKLGALCEQIHRVLGMPGYAATLDLPR